MARYAHLYAESQRQLDEARSKLAKAEVDLGLYRGFIRDEGHIEQFMYWWAKQQGFSDETMGALYDAFKAGKPANR